MVSMWNKRAAVVASAALLSLAIAPAIAQRQGVETQEEVPAVERQSKPQVTDDTPQALRLRSDNAVGVCTTKADSEGEAVENCTDNLKCQPPAEPSCKKRGNFDDWRCVCK